MPLRTRYPAYAAPFAMAQLAFASWETIVRRSLMIAQGTCSAVEYQRMVAEKVAAAQKSALAAARGGSPTAILAPYVTSTRANAKRLRRKG
jgi:hypothetical protein